MASRTKTTLAKQLERAQLAIFGTLMNPDVLDAVTAFGYTEEAIRVGETLFANVQEIRNRATTKRGTRIRKTQAISESETVARDAYSRLAAVLRALFVHDPGARATLGLAGRAPDGRAAFITAAESLFAACLSAPDDLAATLTRYGYPKAKLQAEQGKVFVLRDEHTEQVGSAGDSEQETLALHTALEELNAWVMQYRKIARIALTDQPQLLEKLGISQRTP